MHEIGSEYQRVTPDGGHGLTYPHPGTFVFSGRTAIEAVLKHLPDTHTALLPSYCCESMIIPFRKVGIEVIFYHVWYDKGLQCKIEISSDVDILLWCNYFGFNNEMPDFNSFIERGGIIIEDITHSFFSAYQYHDQSHYLVASIRKWEPINCGGYCAAVKGGLHNIPTALPSDDFVNTKQAAMKLKAEYLYDHDITKKQKFLRLFGESNSWLAENYSELSIDEWSREYLSKVDIQKQREIRRSNAHILYAGLKDKVQFMFSEEEMDCPLFVPILLPENRSEVRSGLTAKEIYCPIHWPKPNGCESNLYDMELSLICDQRYNVEDMEHIVSVLKELL